MYNLQKYQFSIKALVYTTFYMYAPQPLFIFFFTGRSRIYCCPSMYVCVYTFVHDMYYVIVFISLNICTQVCISVCVRVTLQTTHDIHTCKCVDHFFVKNTTRYKI
jgi:hypothetical protein